MSYFNVSVHGIDHKGYYNVSGHGIDHKGYFICEKLFEIVRGRKLLRVFIFAKSEKFRAKTLKICIYLRKFVLPRYNKTVFLNHSVPKFSRAFVLQTLLITLRVAAPSLLQFMFCAMFLFTGFTFCGWVVLGAYHEKVKPVCFLRNSSISR